MRPFVACLLCLVLATQTAPAPAVTPTPTPSSPAGVQAPVPPAALPGSPLPLRARLDRDAIRAAIADVPAERAENPRRHEADTISATPYQAFSQDFAKARLPICLHSEGLKNQPTFFLNGWIALPFVAVAKLRGVCR